MRRLARTLALCLVFAGVSAPAAVSVADLIAVNFAGRVARIDERNGRVTPLGSSGFSRLNSAAADSTGTIFSVGSTSLTPTNDNTLITIDPVTGAGTAVAPVTLDVRAIAFGPDDTLFAVANGLGGVSSRDSLVTIDRMSGAFSVVGDLGLSTVQGLAFSPDGQLFGFEFSASTIPAGLFTIDPLTAATMVVDPFEGFVSQSVQALEFAPDGTLFAGVQDVGLFVLSLDGEAIAIEGTRFADLRGLAFVPEPSAPWMLALALTGLALGAARNSRDADPRGAVLRGSSSSRAIREPR